MTEKMDNPEVIDTIAAGIAAKHICDIYGSCNPTQIIETIKALRLAGYMPSQIPDKK